MGEEKMISESELEIRLMKNDIKTILDMLQKQANLKDNILLMQDEVAGQKEFKLNFTNNVKNIVNQEITSSKNLKSLQKIADERINTFVNSNEFNELVKELIVSKVKIELNDDKSNTYDSVIDIVKLWAMKRERVVFVKILSYFFGSLGLLFAIYRFKVGA